MVEAFNKVTALVCLFGFGMMAGAWVWDKLR